MTVERSENAPVWVYRNLRVKTRVEWVIADKPESRASWRRDDHVTIANVSFKLSEASRLRCLRNLADKSSKYGWDVHAFACGAEVAPGSASAASIPSGPGIEIRYDKFGCGLFVRRDNGAPVEWCELVEFCADGRVIAKGAIR